MPCTTDGFPEDPHNDPDKLIDMLCWVLGKQQSKGWLRADIKEWWAEHQKRDKARKQDEADRKFAEEEEERAQLAKLKKKYGGK